METRQTVLIKVTKTAIPWDGVKTRDTYFVDAVHDFTVAPSTTSISCGPNYLRELTIAREHAAKLGIPVLDQIAVTATIRRMRQEAAA